MSGTTDRPAVTSWWFAGPGNWHRYFGKFNLAARKLGKGEYVVTVTTYEDGKVYETVSGTLAGAKAAGERWVRDNL